MCPPSTCEDFVQIPPYARLGFRSDVRPIRQDRMVQKREAILTTSIHRYLAARIRSRCGLMTATMATGGWGKVSELQAVCRARSSNWSLVGRERASPRPRPARRVSNASATQPA